MIIKRFSVFLAVLLLSLSALTAGNKPLSLRSSNPENGETGVPKDIVLELEFSNNVINLSVQENNRAALSLKVDNGELVGIEVVFPDDQLEPEKKRQISIRPLNPLKGGTTYSLQVDGTFRAKNGSNLGDPLTLSFTTVR